jgi:hypothetical protein
MPRWPTAYSFGVTTPSDSDGGLNENDLLGALRLYGIAGGPQRLVIVEYPG